LGIDQLMSGGRFHLRLTLLVVAHNSLVALITEEYNLIKAAFTAPVRGDAGCRERVDLDVFCFLFSFFSCLLFSDLFALC
jgi:hypothetical protein